MARVLSDDERLKRFGCVVCDDPVAREWVESRLRDGMSRSAVSDLSVRDPDAPRKVYPDTMKRHVQHMTPVTPAGMPDGFLPVSTLPRAQGPTHVQTAEDVATLVQKEVIERLKDGTARVTVQHGLQAQSLLDRREERKQDRALAITLASMLHSQRAPMELLPEAITIEGEVSEVA
jgi:hypothetical protein